MTTIAWDGKELAGDALGNCSGYTFEVEPKIRRMPDGRLVGACGDASVMILMFDWLAAPEGKRGPRPEIQKDQDDGCHVLEIFLDGTVKRHERHGSFVVRSVPHAIGGGCFVAMGAMLAGKSASDAIGIAARSYDGSGKRIDVLTLQKPEPSPSASIARWGWFRQAKAAANKVGWGS